MQSIPWTTRLADKAFLDEETWVSGPQAALVVAGGSQVCVTWSNVSVPEWPGDVGLVNSTGVVFSCTAC